MSDHTTNPDPDGQAADLDQLPEHPNPPEYAPDEDPHRAEFWRMIRSQTEMAGDEIFHAARRAETPADVVDRLQHWQAVLDVLISFAEGYDARHGDRDDLEALQALVDRGLTRLEEYDAD